MIYNEEISIPGTENSGRLNHKVVKRHYPRTNNAQVFEFVFEKDPNLYLRKNKIIIKGSVEVDDGYVPEIGFVAKLFGMLTVEVDSHTISSNKVKYEIR